MVCRVCVHQTSSNLQARSVGHRRVFATRRRFVMACRLPDYLSIPPQDLGRGTPVRVEIVGDIGDVARHFAQALFDEITKLHKEFQNTPLATSFRRPTIHAMVLFISERTSIERQIKRGSEIAEHNRDMMLLEPKFNDS